MLGVATLGIFAAIVECRQVSNCCYVLKLSARIVYKSLNGDAPSYMSDMFSKVNVSTTRSLRNSDYDLRVPFLRTTTGQRCFSYQGAKLWSGLSKRLKIRQLQKIS